MKIKNTLSDIKDYLLSPFRSPLPEQVPTEDQESISSVGEKRFIEEYTFIAVCTEGYALKRYSELSNEDKKRCCNPKEATYIALQLAKSHNEVRQMMMSFL